MDKSTRPVTIYDVARVANVSPSTVSRVVTGTATVREETATRIRDVMQELNYQPNLAARNLQTRESKTLGVILPDISNPFFSEFFLELERCALVEGYTVFLCNTMNNAYDELGDAESVYLRSLVARQVDGIFFLGGRINDRDPTGEQIDEMNDVAKRVPLVLVNGRMRDVGAYVVRSDEQDGFSQLVEYVISLGHREIALVGGITGMLPADVKFRAFRRLLAERGIEVREEWLKTGPFSVEAGERLVGEIVSSADRPTAILCINDYVALGALRSAASAGIRVPADLSVCGFDNISMSAHICPSLTTVSHNFPLLAQRAVDVFLRARHGRRTPKVTTTKMDLVVRESTSKPSR